MLRALRTIIVVNVLLLVFFILANFWIWGEFNSHINALGSGMLGPIWLQHTLSGAFVNGEWIGIGATTLILNFPFWLFFISTAINLYFIYRLQRSKDTKPIE
ncbi:MAG: hypothetical protein GX638_15870 [Crenarchaeota archaeon]|nr:hypothetical protein [Thermoproteota archaeon]